MCRCLHDWCCCCQLRTRYMIIAISGIIYNLIFVMAAGAYVTRAFSAHPLHIGLSYSHTGHMNVTTIIIIGLIFGLVWLVSHVLLIIGAMTGSHYFLIPYLCVTPIHLIAVGIGFMYLLIIDLLKNTYMDLAAYSLPSAAAFGITSCSYSVIRSYHKKLRDIEDEDTSDPRRPYPYKAVTQNIA